MVSPKNKYRVLGLKAKAKFEIFTFLVCHSLYKKSFCRLVDMACDKFAIINSYRVHLSLQLLKNFNCAFLTDLGKGCSSEGFTVFAKRGVMNTKPQTRRSIIPTKIYNSFRIYHRLRWPQVKFFGWCPPNGRKYRAQIVLLTHGRGQHWAFIYPGDTKYSRKYNHK